jgi:stage II sporulation protein D
MLHPLPLNRRAMAIFLAGALATSVAAGCAAKKPRKSPLPPAPPAPVERKIRLAPPPQCPVPGGTSLPAVPPERLDREKPPSPLPPVVTGKLSAPDRIVRVLVAGPAASVAVDGCPVHAWRDDGAPTGEMNGRITFTAEGSRIRFGTTRIEGPVDVGSDGLFTVAGRRLPPGRVRILNRQGKLIAISALSLEEYVAAVLSREASPAFRPEALAALAIAIRTYAVNAAAKPRDPAYDLLNGVDDQVFDGIEKVLPQFRAAAAETRGVLIWYGDALASANYHSTCGGRTEDAADAWGRPFPYLRSVACDDCRESPAWKWEYRLPSDEGKRVARALGLRVRDNLKIEIVATTPTGRAARIRLSSGGVSRETAAAVFRQALGSTKVKSLKMAIARAGDGWKIAGEGYGHGVGLCQWGANGMAGRGCDFREILSRYYPGTRLSGGTT